MSLSRHPFFPKAAGRFHERDMLRYEDSIMGEVTKFFPQLKDLSVSIQNIPRNHAPYLVRCPLTVLPPFQYYSCWILAKRTHVHARLACFPSQRGETRTPRRTLHARSRLLCPDFASRNSIFTVPCSLQIRDVKGATLPQDPRVTGHGTPTIPLCFLRISS